MTDDLMQRAARHRHDPNWEGTPSYCIACSFDDGEAFHDVPWPCLVHDLAAALAAEQAARAKAEARLTKLAAAVDAMRLASGPVEYAKSYGKLLDAKAALAGEEVSGGL